MYYKRFKWRILKIIRDKYNKGRYEDKHVTNKKKQIKKKHVCTTFIDGTFKIEKQCRIQRYTEG